MYRNDVLCFDMNTFVVNMIDHTIISNSFPIFLAAIIKFTFNLLPGTNITDCYLIFFLHFYSM